MARMNKQFPTIITATALLLAFSIKHSYNQEIQKADIDCSSLLPKSAEIIAQDYWAYYPDDAQNHESAPKRRLFSATPEYQSRMQELIALRKKLLTCEFSFTLTPGSFWSPGDGESHYADHHRGFLLFAGEVTEADIVALGQAYSRNVVGFRLSGDIIDLFRPRMGHDEGAGVVQINLSKTITVPLSPGTTVGWHYTILGGLDDRTAVAVDECLSGKNSDFFFRVTFKLSPQVRRWVYASMGPIFSAAKTIAVTREARVELVHRENGKVLRVWR